MTLRYFYSSPCAVALAIAFSIAMGGESYAQTDVDWTGGAPGLWSDASNWSTGSVPTNTAGNFFNVFIDNGSATNSIVNLDVDAFVDSLTIDTNDSLIVDNGFDLNIVRDAGRADSGKLNNDGNLLLDSTGSQTKIHFTNGGEINGSGTITMSGVDARITAGNTAVVTIGANQTIQGEGMISNGSMVTVNNGTIDANVNGGSIEIDPRNNGAGIATFENNGVVKASNGGEMVLSGSGGGEFDGTGEYLAENGSKVTFKSSAVVSDSTFATSGSGVIRADDGDNVFLKNITNTGNLIVGNNTDLGISGTLTNSGNVKLESMGSQSDFELNTNVILNGGGTLEMTGGDAQINASGDFTLTNVDNTIKGRGNLGDGLARVVNQSAIESDSGVLHIDPRNAGSGVATFQNDGTVIAKSGGEVILSGSGGGEFDGSGVYRAEADSQLSLTSFAVVGNTNLESTGTGVVRALDGQNVFLKDVSVSGNLIVGDNTDLGISGTLTNSGNVKLESMGSQSDFELNTNVILNGGGTLEMTGGDAQINASGDFTLTNVDNTIKGRGNLGDGLARVVNQSAIESDSGVLHIDPRNAGSGVATFQNDGTVIAKSGGEVILSGSGGGEFDGSGVYRAEADSQLSLTSFAVVGNTNLESTGTGVVRALDGQNVFLKDVSVSGNLIVGDNTDLGISGTLTNSGNVKLESMGSQSDFELNTNVILNGGGTLEMTGGDAQINASGDFTLTNVDNTIKGRGNLGDGLARVVNQSAIESDSGVLHIDPRNAGSGVATFQNDGTVIAKSGGEVILSGSGGGEFSGSGVYRAEADSQLTLVTSSVLKSTTLDSTGTGTIRVANSASAFLTDVTNTGELFVGNSSTLTVSSSFVNSGNVTLDSVGGASNFRLGANTTLSGGGTLNLINDNSRIISTSAFVLTNADNTIRGFGKIGEGLASIVNESLIKADVAGEALVIDPRNIGGPGSFTNTASGELRASMGGSVIATGIGAGGFDMGGKIVAYDNSSVTFNSSAIVESVAGGVLNKGDWRAMETGSGATLQIDNAASHFTKIGSNAKVMLSGTNANFNHGASHIELDQNDGVFTVAKGKQFKSGIAGVEDFVNNGTVSIVDAKFSNSFGTYTQNAGITELQMGGKLSVNDVAMNSGRIVGNGSIGDMVDQSNSIVLDGNSVIAPGNSAGVIDMYVDPTGDMSLMGTFEIELGGNLIDGMAQDISLVNRSLDFMLAEYDQINVFGDATIEGAILDVSQIDGFVASIGDFFDVFTANELTLNSFTVNGPGGYVFDTQVISLNDVAYGGNRDVLRLTVASVPEPSSFVIVGGLTLGLFMRRRKRSS